MTAWTVKRKLHFFGLENLALEIVYLSPEQPRLTTFNRQLGHCLPKHKHQVADVVQHARRGILRNETCSFACASTFLAIKRSRVANLITAYSPPSDGIFGFPSLVGLLLLEADLMYAPTLLMLRLITSVIDGMPRFRRRRTSIRPFSMSLKSFLSRIIFGGSLMLTRPSTSTESI